VQRQIPNTHSANSINKTVRHKGGRKDPSSSRKKTKKSQKTTREGDSAECASRHPVEKVRKKKKKQYKIIPTIRAPKPKPFQNKQGEQTMQREEKSPTHRKTLLKVPQLFQTKGLHWAARTEVGKPLAEKPSPK